jgi:hypothetical protein
MSGPQGCVMCMECAVFEHSGDEAHQMAYKKTFPVEEAEYHSTTSSHPHSSKPINLPTISSFYPQ